MSEALLHSRYDEEQVTVPSGGYNPGDIVQAPSGRAGVVQGQRPLEEGEVATLKTSGQYEIASGSATTFNAGVIVEWDDTGKLAVADTAGDFDLGTTSKAKVNGETVVRVLLNE